MVEGERILSSSESALLGERYVFSFLSLYMLIYLLFVF